VTWIAPDVERSEHYPARRNDPEREMLRDWLDVAASRGGVRAPQRARRPAPRGHRRLRRPVSRASVTPTPMWCAGPWACTPLPRGCP